MSFSFGSLFHSIGHALASVLSHANQINQAIGEAKTVATAAGIAFSAAGQTGTAAEIAKINDGLTLVSNAVTTGASTETVIGHIANLVNLTNGLVTSGDIGIKNADEQSHIVAVANKVQTVVGKVETSLVAAPAA